MAIQMLGPNTTTFYTTGETPFLDVHFGNTRRVTFDVRSLSTPERLQKLLQGRCWRELGFVSAAASTQSAISHQLASLKAVEEAYDISITQQTRDLRELMLIGSHIALNLTQVARTFTETLNESLWDHPLFAFSDETIHEMEHVCETALGFCEVVGGQITFPMVCVPGGFAATPASFKIKQILTEVRRVMVPSLSHLCRLLAGVQEKFPEVESLRRAVSLRGLNSQGPYPFYEGSLVCEGDNGPQPCTKSELLALAGEVPLIARKTGRKKPESGHGPGHRPASAFLPTDVDFNHEMKTSPSYVSGPLARVQNNSAQLDPVAKQAAHEFGLDRSDASPFANTLARLVEALNGAKRAETLLRGLLRRGLEVQEPELPDYLPATARGTGVVEAPNGLILHDYVFNEQGEVTHSQIIDSTNFNLPALISDIDTLMDSLEAEGVALESIAFWVEVLIRSYDSFLLRMEGRPPTTYSEPAHDVAREPDPDRGPDPGPPPPPQGAPLREEADGFTPRSTCLGDDA